MGFFVPLVLVSLLSLPRNWFVLAHALISGGLVVAYMCWAGVTMRQLWVNWPLGLAFGVAAAFFLVGYVLSLVALPAAINRYITEHNDAPKPFTWTKAPGEILAKLNPPNAPVH